jgi:hypothetical protein
MRVNLISNNRNQTGLSQDVDLIQGIFTIVDSNNTFNRVHHSYPECPEADINIFFEVLNPSLFTYAGVNIWIPNPEWTYKSWKPYFSQLDQIWCKTDHAVELFKPFNPNTTFIGWSSIAKGIAPIKNYSKAIVLAGKNLFRHPQIIINSYAALSTEALSKLPELHVIYDSTRMNVVLPTNISHKITLYPNTLKQKDYDNILSDCGLAICISSAEGFGHAINEAASSGCVLMMTDIPAFTEFGYEGIVVPVDKEINSDRIDKIFNFKPAEVVKAFDTYAGLSFKEKKTISKSNANKYVERHNMWVERMKSVISNLEVPDFSLDDTAIPEEDLPCVTIVTPTRDRIQFMELCAGCVDSQCYPKDKLEWIVIDDGKDTCEDKIKHIPYAKHILAMSGMSIAAKRNLGAQIAKHPVIVHFDDDDIYPPNSILFRVAMLARGNKGAVFCTTLPSYDIKNYISFVNVPPLHLTQSERVSEATLAYTKTFWEEKGFDEDIMIAEGNTFINGREGKCREISPQEVIVSLVHPKTTSSRRAPQGMEPNGCHYGFTDDLFKMLTLIGESLLIKSSQNM